MTKTTMMTMTTNNLAARDAWRPPVPDRYIARRYGARRVSFLPFSISARIARMVAA